MAASAPLRIAHFGEGERARLWAQALRPLADVRADVEQPEDVDAVVLAPGAADPFARANQALQAGVPVLYAAPFLLSRWQAGTLHLLSLRQRRLLRYAELFQERAGFAFLRRALAGREPFWSPLYVRALRLAEVDAGLRLDELATEELAACHALLGATPDTVTAAAGHRHGAGEACAAFLTLHYADGLVVQCTISLAEATSARQLVVATQGRTVILDDLESVASVRILGEHGSPASERMLASTSPDPIAAEAKRFCAAVADCDVALGNSQRWASVAAVWWSARQSMSLGGPVDVQALRAGEAEPPPLRVIQGGGKAARTAPRRPALTVVAG